ncbi:iron-siderophore ABC transporter substrate-binding protein [Amycolatopsis minnesotensis]
MASKRSGARWTALFSALLLATGLVAACGPDQGSSGGTGAAGSTAGFPVTIEHLFGSTTIERKPTRIVTLGGGDMEAAIALDAVPTAGADWFGYTEPRTWVRDALAGRPAPQLIKADQVNFEQIAALRPDLILYVNSKNEQNTYGTLSRIAPTVAAPKGVDHLYGVPWVDQVRTIAKATGTTAKGEEVVTGTQKVLSDAAKANPEFAGKVATAGVFSSGNYSIWMPSDPRMQLLTALGFKTNPAIDALDNGSFYVTLPREQLAKMNSDLVFLAAGDQEGKVNPAVAGDPLFNSLPVAQGRHVAYFGGPGVINTNSAEGAFSSAVSIGGPLGIKYVVDKLVPKLKNALAGK